jgi:hypothetical protein
MNWLSRVGLAVLVVLSALVVTTSAVAGSDDDVVLEPLTTETLITSEAGDPGTSTVTGTCNLLGPSTFDFEVTGVAVGPYPGTFREVGRFTLASPISPLTSFKATFTITSPQGAVTVRGLKTLTGVTSPGLGICGEFAFGGLSANAIDIETPVRYAALITAQGATAIDSGDSFVNYGDTQLRGEPVQGNGFAFVETFNSTSFKQDDDDEDDD